LSEVGTRLVGAMPGAFHWFHWFRCITASGIANFDVFREHSWRQIMRRFAVIAFVCVTFFIGANAPAQWLTSSGTCTGPMTFTVFTASGYPGVRVAFIYSTNTGSWTLPIGMACDGVTTGLAAPVNLGAWATTKPLRSGERQHQHPGWMVGKSMGAMHY
jgi:hypothetical protein